jgi:hypothetical protein
MLEVTWIAVFLVVTAVGIAMVVRRRTRIWVAAGIGYGLGGTGFVTSLTIAVLSTAYDRPGTATDLAVWFGGLGFMALLAGAILTLIALGRRGRHQFLLVLAVTTLTIATYEFWTSNWAARYGDVSDRCFYAALAPGAGVQRVPPGVRCSDPGSGEEVFVPADGICWLALGGWSLFYGFVASFPLMALGWAARRRGGTVLDFPG